MQGLTYEWSNAAGEWDGEVREDALPYGRTLRLRFDGKQLWAGPVDGLLLSWCRGMVHLALEVRGIPMSEQLERWLLYGEGDNAIVGGGERLASYVRQTSLAGRLTPVGDCIAAHVYRSEDSSMTYLRACISGCAELYSKKDDTPVAQSMKWLVDKLEGEILSYIHKLSPDEAKRREQLVRMLLENALEVE